MRTPRLRRIATHASNASPASAAYPAGSGTAEIVTERVYVPVAPSRSKPNSAFAFATLSPLNVIFSNWLISIVPKLPPSNKA
ncbi:MAG: hypothetical protein LBK99_23290 [Opitutaceae bacterium]|nr:hypothetical protein [Opitutaceae bacterium]